MKFQRYLLVLLRKGPKWTAERNPELEALQQSHLKHLSTMAGMGELLLAGPTSDHGPLGDIRGVSILALHSEEELAAKKRLVESDPAVQAGRLQAHYLTWHVPEGSVIQHTPADA